ncbi:hypothetical protein ADN00_07200 [Ornatilinea apprima]|uniref:Tetratricopeptide repeat-like domain-containing protein n=1 Tax=Ornatilinea apprima TaxID=1134406 RepID=A0A0N8GNJ2_9CHLR|nr:tetratricopeptide repeat protein [Ornatilinea apprima]KPL78250.1 hypothetical protein ADN00_07200 [Ornatilinea apprima]
MQERISFALAARIILPLCLLVALQIQPTPVAIQQSLAAQTQPDASPQDQAYGLEQALAREPWRAQLWEQVGFLRAQTGDDQRAVEAWEKSTFLSARGKEALAASYLRLGNREKALALWLDEIHRGRASESAFRQAVGLLREEGRFDEALQLVEDWRQARPESAEAAYTWAVLRLGAGEEPANLLDSLQTGRSYSPQAADALTAAIQALPAERDLAYQKMRLASVLARFGEWDAARGLLEQAVELEGASAEAWALLGEAIFQTGGDGWDAFERAQALNPTSAEIKVLLGLRYRQSGQPEIALGYLQEAARLQPYEGRWQVEIAETLADLGRISSALEHYTQAVAIAPRDSEIAKSLVRFTGNTSVGIQTVGIPAARNLILLDEQDPESQDLMGWLLMKQGDTTSAERFFHQALRLQADYLPAHYHLGQLYLLLNRRADAAYHLMLVIEELPEGEDMRANAERLLKP